VSGLYFIFTVNKALGYLNCI